MLCRNDARAHGLRSWDLCDYAELFHEASEALARCAWSPVVTQRP
jgi:hypothetical protein